MDESEKIQQEILLRLKGIELQLGRIESDVESEKDVRKRRNDGIDSRLLELEKWQAKWGGALIALGIVATIVSLLTAFIKFK